MCFKTLLTFVFLTIAFEQSKGQVGGDGKCPDVKLVDNFNIEAYVGKWYEYARYPVVFEVNGKCVQAQYDLLPDQTVKVHNMMIHEKTEKKQEITGIAKSIANAKLEVTFGLNPFYNATGNYWVLDTDYTSYSVVYACKEIPTDITATMAWILTRERFPPSNVIELGKAAFLRNKLSLQELEYTDQLNCAA